MHRCPVHQSPVDQNIAVFVLLHLTVDILHRFFIFSYITGFPIPFHIEIRNFLIYIPVGIVDLHRL